jgi:predicted amidohydrolase
MKVSMIQMRVSEDKRENISRAEELISSCRGADVIMLPEMFCCPYSPASFVKNAEPEGGPVTSALSRAAKEAGAYLIGGSMPEAEGGRIYNTCFVYSPAGERIARHRKAHLFDVNVKGGQVFMESETLTAGEGATVFETPFGRFGVCICFDIRFPELMLSMRGIEALFVPAAFNMTTGPMHWELLFRARAVDGQFFAFGCAPARDETSSYISYANSICVSPWGRVIAQADEKERIISVDIDLSETCAAREQIPIGNL